MLLVLPMLLNIVAKVICTVVCIDVTQLSLKMDSLLVTCLLVEAEFWTKWHESNIDVFPEQYLLVIKWFCIVICWLWVRSCDPPDSRSGSCSALISMFITDVTAYYIVCISVMLEG